MPYNIMTCQGWENAGDIFGPCSQAWFAVVLVFFAAVFLRVGLQSMGMNYSQMFGIIGGLLLYLIIISLFGVIGWAILAGIVGALAGGLLLGGFGE